MIFKHCTEAQTQANNFFEIKVETGAPMICQSSNTEKGFYIAGVISFVVSDRMDLPMGVTGLSHYTPWLKMHLNEVVSTSFPYIQRLTYSYFSGHYKKK